MFTSSSPPHISRISTSYGSPHPPVTKSESASRRHKLLFHLANVRELRVENGGVAFVMLNQGDSRMLVLSVCIFFAIWHVPIILGWIVRCLFGRRFYGNNFWRLILIILNIVECRVLRISKRPSSIGQINIYIYMIYILKHMHGAGHLIMC